nr:hypothetical protein [Tanacetum cinerariifolium]
KSKRKDTQVPQLSGPTESVTNEAVYKELDDSLVRATTTASSLEAEQDNGNINKTQSKVTPNESSSQGTDSGGGPRCQETMGDTIAQTRSERVSKLSNDSLLARDLHGEEVFVAKQDENVAEKEVDVAQDKGKSIMIKEPVKLKKKYQIMLDEEIALKSQAKLQAEFNKEQRLARERAQKELEPNIALMETSDYVQAKIDKIYKEGKMRYYQIIRAGGKSKMYLVYSKNFANSNNLHSLVDTERFHEVPRNSHNKDIVVGENYQIGHNRDRKKSYYQIVRADGKFQKYMIISQMLKSFDREDLEDLYELVKARYGSTRPVEIMDYLLWSDMKIMFDPHVEDKVWKMQQGYKVLE